MPNPLVAPAPPSSKPALKLDGIPVSLTIACPCFSFNPPDNPAFTPPKPAPPLICIPVSLTIACPCLNPNPPAGPAPPVLSLP